MDLKDLMAIVVWKVVNFSLLNRHPHRDPVDGAKPTHVVLGGLTLRTL